MSIITTIYGDLLPDYDNANDIGSTSVYFKDLYLKGSLKDGTNTKTLAEILALTQYTDEMAQDAVGGMIGTSLQYVDATPLLDTIQDIRTSASPTFANLTDSGLTITRIPFASTSGLLIDSADIIFDGTSLNVHGLTVHSFTTAGVVHNAVATGILSSSLIVNADITGNTITYASLQQVSANNMVLGNVSGAAGNVAELTAANLKTMCGYYTSGDAITTSNLTDSGLTITRIPFASTAGLLVDNTNFIYTTASSALQNTGQTTFIAGAAATVPLTSQGAASQSADLFQLKKSDGTIYTAFDSVGKLLFGPSGAQDCNLYRITANNLKTDDSLTVVGTLNAKTLVKDTADGLDFWIRNSIADSGYWMRFSTLNASDVATERFRMTNRVDTASVSFINCNVGFGTGTPATQISIASAGKISWEVSTGVVDTNLYRSAANMLKTDDGLTVMLNSGFGATVPESQLEIETTDAIGIQALTIDQNDADKAFIDYQGTSSGDAVNNISTWTVATIKGYFKGEINGVEGWFPVYNAPTA